MAATTMNGWSLTSVPLATITAGGHSTQVRAGAVAVVLGHVARRFHAEVEPLVTFYGWRSVATNAAVGGHPRSNHPSGTAFDANGYRHPYKAKVNFTAAQVAAIRRILAEVAPVVRWGGDFGAALRDGMHFEIVGTAAQVAAVAARLTTHPTPAPAPAPLTPLPLSKEDDIMARDAIDAQYRTVIGRTPGNAEADPRVLRVARGKSTLVAELDALAASPEAYEWSMSLIYADELGRRSAASEASYWWSIHHSDFAAIRAGVRASGEAVTFRALPAATRAAKTAAAKAIH